MGKAATLLLTLMLLGLQYRLWVADGGIAHTHRLTREIAAQRADLERLRARNDALEAEVVDLKSGIGAIEARARESLGMIYQTETFYLVVAD